MSRERSLPTGRKQRSGSRQTERVDYADRIGCGAFILSVYQKKGSFSRNDMPKKGGPMVLLAPGYKEEQGISREKIANGLAAAGITAGVVRHTDRIGFMNMVHAREQRAKGVYGSGWLAVALLEPVVVAEGGQSFGGVNVNDANVSRYQKARYGHQVLMDGRIWTPPRAIIHEDTPGNFEVFNNHSHPLKTARQEGMTLLTHPGFTATMVMHDIMHPIEAMAEMGTDFGEAVALRHIDIGPGKDFLKSQNVKIFDVYHRRDTMVPPPAFPDENTTIMDGDHFESAVNPGPMVGFYLNIVLPALERMR